MKVIVTSAYGEEFAASFLQEKIEVFLRKPYGVSALLDLFGRVLPRQGQET
jgi:hypothetical protein